MVQKLSSFLKDSTITIRKFDQIHCTNETLLVTCDVEALYTNISHKHGITAITYFQVKQEDNNGMHHLFIIDLLDYLLKHNFFVFDGCFYKQISGTAMGARCASSYANLFFGLVGGDIRVHHDTRSATCHPLVTLYRWYYIPVDWVKAWLFGFLH